MELTDKPEKPDFVFVDGNHDYKYALFDLMCCARIVKPGGIIFMDYYCDPGVNAAVQRFWSDNPDWPDVTFSGHRAFGPNYEHVILDNLYKIFVVPRPSPLTGSRRPFTRPSPSTPTASRDFISIWQSRHPPGDCTTRPTCARSRGNFI